MSSMNTAILGYLKKLMTIRLENTLLLYTHRDSLKNCSIDQLFFYRLRTFQLSFFLFFESYHFLKIMKRKCKKKPLNFVAAILDFWRPSWIDNGYFLTLYSIHGNIYLYQFWCFYHKVNDQLTGLSYHVS